MGLFMSFLDAVPGGESGKKKNLFKKGNIAGRSERSRRRPTREIPLDKQNLNLKQCFAAKNATARDFAQFCESAFGLSVDVKTVYSHKSGVWRDLREHWKLKYLAFFHYLGN